MFFIDVMKDKDCFKINGIFGCFQKINILEEIQEILSKIPNVRNGFYLVSFDALDEEIEPIENEDGDCEYYFYPVSWTDVRKDILINTIDKTKEFSWED